MAQHDFVINNQGFPAFRSDLNDFLNAVRTTHSGTSLPSGAVAGTIWLDTTNATTPILKYYDGTDNITLATINHSTNTVDFNDSAITTPLTVTGNSTAGAELRLPEDTDNGSNYVALKAPDTLASNLTFTLPSSDGTNGQVLGTNGSGVLSFTTPSVGISWQSTVKTSGFTATAGEGYFCNTTSAGFTVTLPSTPTAGQQVAVVDYAGTFDTNALTISPNGNKIEGGLNNLQLKGEREGVLLVYIDSTQGWLATSGINEGTDALEPETYSIDFLVVAGGGGSGDSQAGPQFSVGGGGAGGFRTSTQTVSVGTAITVTVGDGGAVNTAGSNSSISGSGLTTITSNGGGNGGNSNTVGTNGGSGGGGGGSNIVLAGGNGNTPSTSPSQGNNGGSGDIGVTSGGGGGGAGAVGTNASSPSGGNGGTGTASSITGSSVTRAGGGGGGAGFSGSTGTGGSAGSGGGGAGSGTASGTAGTANTGGGGGGSRGTFVGSAGGKGVVILSVPTAKYSSTTTGSPTVTTSGSNTIMVFNGSGSYTA